MPEPLDQLTAALAERYRIERELGVGGMAIVYPAHDIKHNRQVALKVIRPFSFFDAQYFVAMGFNKRTLTFFRQLALHNEKLWFEAHRDGYENDVRAPM